jgi:hypothetical protein
MSWLDELSLEPHARGVPRRERARIATAEARRSAFATFAALAVAAVVLIVSQVTLARIARYPGYANGISMLLFFAAVLGMLVAPQVALVGGTLAAWRVLRRRRVAILPAREAASWLGLIGGLAAVAGLGLIAACRTQLRARAIVSDAAGQAGDIYDDLRVLGWDWLRTRPWLLGALASVAVGLALGAFEAHAEVSIIEGIQRGLFEGAAAALGFLLLGRAIDARR